MCSCVVTSWLTIHCMRKRAADRGRLLRRQRPAAEPARVAEKERRAGLVRKAGGETEEVDAQPALLREMAHAAGEILPVAVVEDDHAAGLQVLRRQLRAARAVLAV